MYISLLLKPDFTFRVLILLMIVMLCSLFIAIKSKQAFAIDIINKAIVTEDSFKLSDIFTDITPEKDVVLGISPKAGDEITLNARTLLRLSSVYNLGWSPQSITDRVTIKRNATIVKEETINNAITSEIEKKMNGRKVKLIISGALPEINLSPELPATVEVSSLDINDKGWFEANIASPSISNPVKTATIYGEARKIISVPVVKNALKNGYIIGSNDIEWLDIEERNIKYNAIINAEDIIGKTPRRMIRPQTILLDNDLEMPQLVKRGENVTILFENGALMLSADGKALEDGAQGEFIKVVNSGSNRTIEAVVEDTRLVRVIR